MRLALLCCATLLVAACSSGGPVKTGPNTYYLTKKSAGCGFTGGEGAKADLLREAGSFCAKQGKEVRALDTDAKHGVPFVRCASAEVNLECDPPSGG